jgi:hypothetical protein
MEIIKFIVWAIKKMSVGSRTLFSVILWCGIFFVNLFILGPTAAANIMTGGFVVIGLLYAVLSIYKAISDSWERYKYEKEVEAHLIVERLRERA